MKSILEEAQDLVYGDREKAYGSPLEDFKKVAELWSVVLGVEVQAKDVPLCMIMLKVSREMHKHGRDNLVDIAGYAGTLEKVWTEMEENLSDGARDYLNDKEAESLSKKVSQVVPVMTGEGEERSEGISRFWIVCPACLRTQYSNTPWDTVPDCAFCKCPRRRAGSLEKQDYSTPDGIAKAYVKNVESFIEERKGTKLYHVICPHCTCDNKALAPWLLPAKCSHCLAVMTEKQIEERYAREERLNG